MSIDEATALVLIRSFVQRIERNSGAENYTLRGTISLEEFRALELLSGQSSEPVTTTTAKTVSYKLNLACIESVEKSPEDLLLCIDFGTAMSKAWATGSRPDRQIPLLLGLRAGQGSGLPLVSAVFIARNGRLYFGKAAETLGNDNARHGHKRFDNLKRILSQGADDRDPDAVPIAREINPTSTEISQGELIVLYLAFLTDMALTDLCQVEAKRLRGMPVDADDVELTADELRPRFVQRRFALPCFGGQRAVAVKKWLRNAILKAQILADTFSKNWEHLTLEEARAALDEVAKLHSLPTHLLDENSAVAEPIAAASSRYQDTIDQLLSAPGLEAELAKAGIDRLRRSLLVVDAGAGTTDFAMLAVVHEIEKGMSSFFTVSPSVDFEYAAGNSIDAALREAIVRKHGIARDRMSGDEFEQVESDLDARIRDIKETLLRTGRYEAVLGPATAIEMTRDEFLTDPGLKKLSDRLREKLKSVLGRLGDRYFETMAGRAEEVLVLITGGSGQMEIFQSLGKGRLEVKGVSFKFKLVKDVPASIENVGLGAVYPQMAVSAGGAAKELPREAAELPAQVAVAPVGERILEKYQTQGL